MDAYQRTRSNRLKSVIIYGLIFLVPAVATFVLVHMHFRGLPPRYESEMTFRVDPHLSPNDALTANGSDGNGSGAAPVLDLDVRQIKIEIRSRERLVDALKELGFYQARESDEKRTLLVQQLRENLKVNIDREPGNDAYLVEVTVTMPTERPQDIEELLKRIRQVYMKYTIEARIAMANQNVGALRATVEEAQRQFQRDDKLLADFEANEENGKLLGNPPPIIGEIDDLVKRIQRLDDSTSESDAQTRAALQKRLDIKKELEKNTPRVVSRHTFLKERRNDRMTRLKEDEKKLAEEVAYHAFLRNKADTRFQVVDQPTSRPVESEQTSRSILGVALGVIAGLGAVLFCLLFRILGYTNEE